MTRAIAYIRVSTEEQAEHGVSLDAQRAKVAAYCVANDLELMAVMEDAGISAKRADTRPALQAALVACKRGEAQALIVVKLDRLARNTVDALEIADALDAAGVALHSISERIDTQSATGRFFYTLLASLAEMERRQTAERTAVAMRHKRARGEYIGGDAPFGYRIEGGRIVPDEQETRIVDILYSLHADGMSWRSIAAELNARGITTRHGGKWQAVQVQRAVAHITNWRAAA